MTLLTADPIKSQEITKDLRQRIQEQIDYFGRTLPERHAIAWSGYLAALWEKGLLTYDDYDALDNMLPEVDPAPIRDIFIFEPESTLSTNA